MEPFGSRLARAVLRHGPFCAGIDPHPELLRAWGLDDDVAGLRRFAFTAAEALAGHVAAVKPQSAFFERHGSGGVAVLEDVVAVLAGSDTQCIVDAKRGDIGSTMQAYADAYCGNGSPLAGDAVTVSPFLGVASLRPVLDVAARTGRGVFVLALTSNPGGDLVQHARGPAGHSVAADLVAAVGAHNRAAGTSPDAVEAGSAGTGSVGLVVGATVGDAVRRLGLDLTEVAGPLLAPGLGAQGATAADLRDVFATARGAVLASSSRGVLAAGPDPAALRAAARRTAEECAAALTG